MIPFGPVAFGQREDLLALSGDSHHTVLLARSSGAAER